MALAQPTSEERALEKKGYILGKKLGQGSYAKVRLAEYLAEGRKENLACKIVDRSKAPVDFVTKFFPRELHIITLLDHPNIIRVHSILERQDKVFIFMQVAEGGDLLDYIKRTGVVPELQSKIWFKQLTNALHYLHQKDIAHRDLKCENLLLTKNLNIKIADFGFSRECKDKEGKRVLSETYCGSAAYAAPEVVRGSPYNPKMADVWSIGVILFIMVNAAMPFDDTNLKKMLKDQMNKSWSFRNRVKDKLSQEIKKMISIMLEPDVTKRITLERILKHEWMKSLEAKTVIPTKTDVIINDIKDLRDERNKDANAMVSG